METNLQIAIDETLFEKIIDTVPDMPDHIFSKRFQKRMRKLINGVEYVQKQRKSMRRILYAVVIAIIMVLAMVFNVSAVRELFKKFFMELFKTHTSVKSVDYGGYPESIEEIYEITFMPDNYELVFKTEAAEFTPWVTTEYRNDESYFVLVQYAKNYYSVNVNSENNPVRYIEINGEEGYWVDMGNEKLISWNKADYVFTLEGNVGEDLLILIAESVRKVN
ncbi:MAG: DUF4367 domain-containing protein [Clostridiales bacterium]|nr:DUF4367 domain-containing protein [Clostridiales bacterium]